MGGNRTWLCANCDTPVEKATTSRCPTCEHVFFYPAATAVADSEGTGSIAVENFDIEDAIARTEWKS